MLGIDPPCDPAIQPLDVYPKDSIAYSRDTGSSMSIAVLSTIVRKQWCIYTMEYFSSVKKSEILKFAYKWIFWGKVIQAQKDKYHMFFLMGMLAFNLQMCVFSLHYTQVFPRGMINSLMQLQALQAVITGLARLVQQWHEHCGVTNHFLVGFNTCSTG